MIKQHQKMTLAKTYVYTLHCKNEISPEFCILKEVQTLAYIGQNIIEKFQKMDPVKESDILQWNF